MAKKKSNKNKGGGDAATAAAAAVTAVPVDDDNDKDDTEPPPDGTTDEEEEEILEFLQIDLGDMAKMKQVLDETVALAVLEHVDEDYTWDNYKLIVMTLACIFATCAQFIPLPFPQSRPILGACGIMYFVMSGILQLITTFVDRDAILFTRPVDEVVVTSSDDNKNKIEKNENKFIETYGFRVRTNFIRFSENYSVIFEYQVEKKRPAASLLSEEDVALAKRVHVEGKWSVGQFFDKDGYFDEIGVQEEVDKLVARFVAGDYDDLPGEKAEKQKKKEAAAEKKKQ